MIRRLLFFPPLCLAFIFLACGDSDTKGIVEVLTKRENAFETKNTDLYLSCFKKDYKEQRDSVAVGIEELRKNFSSNVSLFDKIEISLIDRTFHKRGKVTEVFQKIRVDVKLQNDDSRFQVKEKIDFEKINGAWQIVKESDTDFLTGFVFGEMK